MVCTFGTFLRCRCKFVDFLPIFYQSFVVELMKLTSSQGAEVIELNVGRQGHVLSADVDLICFVSLQVR